MLHRLRSGVPRQDGAKPLLSVIVPTRNEAGNVAPLLARIQAATVGIKTEVIFVDDSSDETPNVIFELTRTSEVPVILRHRTPENRTGGLGGAVVEGFRAARGEWLCVMDADLQHPPEYIPRLLDHAQSTRSDLTSASRFAESGRVQGLKATRFAVSKVFITLAKTFFPRRLRASTDPLTGFFLLRRSAVDVDKLQPKGFKILLEILVRFPRLKVSEIPFTFEQRLSGESKASAREVSRFLTLLLALRLGPSFGRVSRFGAVGLSGIVVNQSLLVFFAELLGLHYMLSAALATQGSTTWNYGLTESWVYRDQASGKGRLGRFARYAGTNNLLLLLRGPFLVLLTSGLGMHYLVSNFLTLAVLFVARYQLADNWIWPNKIGATMSKVYNYNVHDIVRITSDVRLPELSFFLTPTPQADPDIAVRIGGAKPTSDTAVRPRHLRYGEVFGRAGFWVDIDQGETTSISAGPLLRHSPHVLYTNVVEPVLRWMFVQKGYALMHAACLSVNGRGVLVTAKTDTGKTSTLLRVLAKEPLDFLSDDMIILNRDGQALCYPKPLTISSHTLGSVNGAADLTRWERTTLKLQSRVHSKKGRLIAKLLALIPVPSMATVNAIVQLIIPPPKYSINRLVPGTRIARDAMISHRVEIERGPDFESELGAQVAEETLLRNCDDAYGFPPYEALEPFLAKIGGLDLREKEREIIHEALQDCGTTLVSSESRTWWPRVLDIARFHGGVRTLQPVQQLAGSMPMGELAA